MRWTQCRLKQLGEIVGGATPSTKDEDNYNGDIIWITPKDLSVLKGRYISKGERSITEKGFRSCSTKMLPKGSVLFSSRAPIGYVAIAGRDLCTNQGFKSIIPKNNVDGMFLYYALVFNRKKIEKLGTKTTFNEVSGNVMSNVEIRIPEKLADQECVSHLLAVIDEKIEINNAINDNLA